MKLYKILMLSTLFLFLSQAFVIYGSGYYGSGLALIPTLLNSSSGGSTLQGVSSTTLTGVLAQINDNTQVNKFLASASRVTSCSVGSGGCNAGDIVTPSIFVDTRQKLDDILGCNLSVLQDRIIYIYNEFGFWSGERAHAYSDISSNPSWTDDQIKQQVLSKYPGPGVYLIALSAVPELVNRVGKDVPCAAGQIKIAAILFYDDGTGLQPLSASCIALNPTDNFSISISSNTAGAISLPAGVTAFTGTLSTTGSVTFQAYKIVQNTSGTSSGSSSSTSSTSTTKIPANLGNSPQNIVLQKQ